MIAVPIFTQSPQEHKVSHMKANEASLLSLLKQVTQFDTPIFQRRYSWGADQLRDLQNDILRAGRDETLAVHFTGSIVYIQSGHYSALDNPPLHLIDGQQRVTSVTLLLAALANTLGDREPIDGFSAKKIKNYYLVNPEETARRYKLLLTEPDRETLFSIIDNHPRPTSASQRVEENYENMLQFIKKHDKELDVICKGIRKLFVVNVCLTRGQDSPQMIFESLNSTGLQLSASDHIRNYLLMDLPSDEQALLYKNYWKPMEEGFGQAELTENFDLYTRDFLTAKSGALAKKRNLYDDFKAYARKTVAADPENGVETVLAEYNRFAKHFQNIVLDHEPDPVLNDVFDDIRDLRVAVVYPFLLNVYDDYDQGRITHDQMVAVGRIVESYVFRRVVCDVPTSSMNYTFASLYEEVDPEDYVTSISNALMRLRSYKRFPDDNEFRERFEKRDLYNMARKHYSLRKLENSYRLKEHIVVSNYTIEHVMPQNPDVSEEWKQELGEEWERIHRDYLHTLGNLTLTEYNSEYSDKSFQEKKNLPGKGINTSPLHINRSLRETERWNEGAIRSRAKELSEQAIKTWALPAPPPAINIAPSRPISKYSLEELEYFETGSHPRALLDAVLPQILDLDESITYRVNKHYISFFVDRVFVEIVPRKVGLQIVLNIPHHELYDPTKQSVDVSAVGHLGIGTTKCTLQSESEIQYAMLLVTQALEKQLAAQE